jgi:flavin reductase (DIM6/NTAB) family NADH-FMN oxidoreductase RutF
MKSPEVEVMKKELEARNYLGPMPLVLVGANIEGRPNFIAIAFVGIMDYSHVSIASAQIHYTNAGIKENGTFSVNIPSVDLVKEADYCGIVSGKKVDKSGVFEVFYGKLETAPMIAECPVNMECELLKTVDMPGRDVFVGKIVETYAEESCLTEGKVDYAKVNPFFYGNYSNDYWDLGEVFARAFSVGKELEE